MTTEKLIEEVKGTIESNYSNLVYSVKTKMPYPADVVKRMQARYPNFPDLSHKEYKYLVWQTEISMQEYMLITAKQVSMALEAVKEKFTDHEWAALMGEYNWLKSWQKDDFAGYEVAKAHLEKVDRYHLDKYGQHYDLWYINKERQIELIKWSDELKDRLIEKYKKGEKAKKQSILSDY